MPSRLNWTTNPAATTVVQTQAPFESAAGSTTNPDIASQLSAAIGGYRPLARVSPPTSNDAVHLEWTNLHLTPGSDGGNHLYYLVTGGPEGSPARFNLRITNTGEDWLKDTWIKLRLSSRHEDGLYETIALAGQGNEEFKRWQSEDLSKGDQRDVPLLIDTETLQRAYDADSPLTRLEVEFHWRRDLNGGRSYHYNRHVLSFYLVRPVEFLIDSGRFQGELRLNEDRHEQTWLPIYEKHFSTGDSSAVEISSKIKSGLTWTQHGEASFTARASETREEGRSGSVESREQFSFGIDEVIQLGIESETTESQGWSLNRSETREFARSVSHSRTFARSYERERVVTSVIQPGTPGETRTLYVYPVFRRYLVDVVRFSGPNSLGQATNRVQNSGFPLLMFSNWGEIQRVRQAAAAQSWQLTEQIAAAQNETPAPAADTMPETSAPAVIETLIYDEVREHIDPSNFPIDIPEPGRGDEVHRARIPAGLKFSRWEVRYIEASPGVGHEISRQPQRGSSGNATLGLKWWHLPYGKLRYRVRLYASPDGTPGVPESMTVGDPGYETWIREQISQDAPAQIKIKGEDAKRVHELLQQRMAETEPAPGSPPVGRQLVATIVIIAIIAAIVIVIGMAVLAVILYEAMERDYDIEDTKYKAAVGSGETKQEHELAFNLTKPRPA